MDETSNESASAFLERIVEKALEPYVWRLEEVVSAFEDAADRLIEEQWRLDMMKSEMARKDNGQDARK